MQCTNLLLEERCTIPTFTKRGGDIYVAIYMLTSFTHTTISMHENMPTITITVNIAGSAADTGPNGGMHVPN